MLNITNLLRQLQTECEALTQCHFDATGKVAELTELLASKENELAILKQTHADAMARVKEAHEYKVRELESELWNFKKVSQLVAFEKENATLRREVERLVKLVELHQQTIPAPPAPPPYEGYAKSGHSISGAGIAPIAQEIVKAVKAKPVRKAKTPPVPPPTLQDNQMNNQSEQSEEAIDEKIDAFAASTVMTELVAQVVNDVVATDAFDESTLHQQDVDKDQQDENLEHNQEHDNGNDQKQETNDMRETSSVDSHMIEEVEEEAEIQVYEKKIQGKLYYVDDAHNIYAIDEEGGVGDVIGTFSKVNGKILPQWNN